VYFLEAEEAREHGDTGVATGNAVVATGSALILTASLVNGAGYLLEATALTAAASTFLVIGVVVLVVGYTLLAIFSTSSWQKFARRCSFGTEPAQAGHEIWSGGDFAEWTETKEGLDRQIQVMTAMMCAFKVSGTFKTSGQGSDAESAAITFGNLPPKSKLEVSFEIEYEGGVTHTPKYVIDLETLHYTCAGTAKSLADFQPYSRDGHVHSILLSSDRPPAAQGAKVLKSKVSALVRYARKMNHSVTSGTIPIAGALEYEVYDESSGENIQEASSMDSGEE
jgi:hypothetical protein